MIKRLVFFALIFFLPFQFGYHFWLPQSFISSFRIDYLSPTLYLVDLLIILYLVLHPRVLWQSTRSLFATKLGLLFLALVLLNLGSTSINPITALAWLRLLEYYLLYRVLCTEKHLVRDTKTPFLLSLYVVLSLALLQFLFQSSLGGPFYYLGERPLSISAPNIAKLNLPTANCQLPTANCQILRPYSTFSHPNSLAGYLLIVLILLPLFVRSKFLKVVISIVVILTFSKAAILALVLVEAFRLNLSRSLILSFFLSLTPLLQSAVNFPSWLRLSFTSRHYLILPTLRIIKEHWLTGVGLRQFTPHLATLLPGNQLSYLTLQPVHNTFLLIAGEIGLVGILLLIELANKITPQKNLIRIVGVILLTGSLDHYWWTLPQNQLIIILALALMINQSSFPSPVIRRGASILAGEAK